MLFFLIYGMSGSGKTTISTEMSRFFLNKRITTSIIPLDFFYKEKYPYSFDEPQAFDWRRLMAVIYKLKLNKEVILHPYNYETKLYDTTRKHIIYPSNILIIEGIYANYCRFLLLENPAVIQIETPPDICLARRVLRDKRDRGIEPIDNIKRWLDDVKPNWDKWSNNMDRTLESNYSISGINEIERYALYETLFNDFI